jgi:uncharacterized protein (DUF58 family)
MPRRRWSFLMPAEDHLIIKRFLTYFPAGFTDSGRILVCVLLASACIAAPGLHISAYLLPCLTLALLMTAIGFAYFHRPRLIVKRSWPTAPSAGEDMIYRVVIQNVGRKLIQNVSLFEKMLPFGIYNIPYHDRVSRTVDLLLPGETASLTLAVHCKYRGIYHLPALWAGSSFPSNIFRWLVTVGEPQRLIVYPAFNSQREFRLPFHRVYQPGGIAISSNVGNSNEFLNTREYRQGDRLRDIHWPSYARTGRLIVKEYVDEYFVRIGLLLDTELSRKDTTDSLEKRISVAAGIADAIAKREYIIDLFAAGEMLHHFQMGRALAHLDNLLELLACIEGVNQIHFDRLQLNLTPYLRQLSSMIILLKDWDEKRKEFCQSLTNMGISLRIIVISDQPLTHLPDREVVHVRGYGKDTLIT